MKKRKNNSPSEVLESFNRHVSVTRSGGFAGTLRRWTLDPATVPPALWKAWKKGLPTPTAKSADRFLYRVSARDGDFHTEVMYNESTLPTALRDRLA